MGHREPAQRDLGYEVRALADRIRRLEARPAPADLGGWRLAAIDGALVAVHVPTGRRVVLADQPTGPEPSPVASAGEVS